MDNVLTVHLDAVMKTANTGVQSKTYSMIIYECSLDKSLSHWKALELTDG